MPLVAKRSFAPHGIPCSGPRYLPLLISRSACAAWARASSSVSVTKTVQSRAVLFQALEVHLRQVGGRHVTTLNERREGRHRQEGKIVQRCRPRGRRLQPDVDFCARCRARFRFLARQVRPERDRRLGIERNVHAAQPFVRVEIPVDAVERLFFLLLGEINAEDLLRAVQRLLAETRSLLPLLRKCRNGDTRRHRRRYRLQKSSSFHFFLRSGKAPSALARSRYSELLRAGASVRFTSATTSGTDC